MIVIEVVFDGIKGFLLNTDKFSFKISLPFNLFYFRKNRPMYLKNLPIKRKLLTMLVLPLLGILVFSGMIVFDRVSQVQDASQLIKDAEFFSEIGTVAHSLQKERGTSVAFVSSKGAKMADKLPTMRHDSDKAIQVLTKNINERIVKGDTALQNTLNTLAKLNTLRQKSSEFQIDGLACAAQYTGIIQSILELSSTLANSAKNTKIMRGANAYSAYLNVKERAGRERAILAGIFAIDKMDLPHLLKLSGNLGESNASFNLFTQIATSEQIEFHKQTVTGKSVTEVDTMRKHALESALDTSLGIDNAYWFEQSTARINLMKMVEDKLVADLLSSANAIKSAAMTMLTMMLIVTILVVLVTFILITKITNAITSPLNLMKNTLLEVNRTGDFSKKLNYQSNDEIGEMTVAFNAMMATLQAALESVNKVMNAISQGEFNVQVDTDVSGDLNELKMNVNETVGQLRITMFTLNDVMNSLYNADFANVVVAHVKGNYKKILDKAIHSQEALRIMLSDIGGVMEHVAAGNLNHRVTAEGRGELLLLKENINSTLTSLGSLNEIVRVAEALARGDLTQSITGNYPGVFGQVTVSMNNTAENLKNLISNVHNAAEMINAAAKEIASGNNDLSHRTEKQASSLEETAASMQELTENVGQNNTHATDASKMANEAAEIASRGVEVVNSVVTTMDEINDSSHRIVDIISVIDDIAFQTNILALNAAVEAARAGDSGKGFAVVAIEVRNLAQRAANAAGEIKRLISDSVERVSGGSKQVADAGKTMSDIVDSIRNVSVIITDITAASSDQTAGISQVNQAIRQMDDVTQQNAALVEQAAAAAESLEDQTRDLSRTLSNFRI
jgi:methyl-accepting chemotaxis protein